MAAGFSMEDTGGLAAREIAAWKASREAVRSNPKTTLFAAGISWQKAHDRKQCTDEGCMHTLGSMAYKGEDPPKPKFGGRPPVTDEGLVLFWLL